MKDNPPLLTIEGTAFFIDVKNLSLREKGDVDNSISIFEMKDVGDGYVFDYCSKVKNIPVAFNHTTTEVKIPDLVVLDPIGMANKYSIPVSQVKGKTDFDLMVDQKAFDLRVHKGILPTVQIAGHTFYVDIRMDMLRPKDDFLSKGIVFSDIDHYFSEEKESYMIPYDPKKHEFKELDYDHITSIPKNLIAVEFPFQKILDPIGWNRDGGWDLKDDLKQIGLNMNFQATTIPWSETYITDIIRGNLESKKIPDNKPMKTSIENKKPKSRGNKM